MERFKSGVCVDAIITKEDKGIEKILLMKRQNTGDNDNEYEIPGGHLDPNEDLYSAMIRELKEELKITLKRKDLNLVEVIHHYTGQRFNFIFQIDGKNLTPKIGEPDKCSKLLWTNINRLPKSTTPKMRKIITNYKNNKFYDKI